MDIAWKELFAIVMAVHTWGSLWQRQKILFHCNNQAVISIWESGTTRAKNIMALVRLLYYRTAGIICEAQFLRTIKFPF